MTASIYEVCFADPTVTARLGSSPMRFFPTIAPEGTLLPYATFQTIGGGPENFLAGRPDIDDYRIQIDVFARTAVEASEIDMIIRTAIELRCNVIRFNGQFTEEETRLERSGFDIRWFENR